MPINKKGDDTKAKSSYVEYVPSGMVTPMPNREKKFFGAFRESLAPMPNLVSSQLESFKWLVEEGLTEVFDEFKSISDFTGKKFELEFTDFELGEAPHSDEYAKEYKGSYEIPLKVKVKLKNKILGTDNEQEIFLTDIPAMTDRGTFIVNGVERVLIPQLARSYGIFFTSNIIKGKKYFGAKAMPARGVWVEIESETDGAIYVRIDRKRRFPITTLFRVFGTPSNEEIIELFKDSPAAEQIEQTLDVDASDSLDTACVEIYKRLRDGDLASLENARDFVRGVFSSERYDLSRVGRFSFNKRFGRSLDEAVLEERTLNKDDLVTVVNHIAELNQTPNAMADDIDHLGSRRVRYVGELMQQRIRVGMTQIKRNIQNRMSTMDTDVTTPVQFISTKPLQARIKEFFSTNQLSKFMQQENALMELEDLRTLSALGPGGLTRTRAGFEVRDVHTSHYGRLCPIQTPEGPNIGLILRLCVYARVNKFGMIESPYGRVKNGRITGEVDFLNALEEEKYKIAHAAIDYDKDGKIKDQYVEARIKGHPASIKPEEVDYIDVATNQAFSVATSLVPFLNHNDANRALMGSNMQKQGTPCLIPEAPLVATGIERKAVIDTGRLIMAEEKGEVVYVDAGKIRVKYEKAPVSTNSSKKSSSKSAETEITYPLKIYSRTNSFTAFHHRPTVNVGDKVKKGDVLADSSSSDGGQLALGQNCLVAFMTWYGTNYEDAIIISERMVRNNKLSSVHVAEFVINVRDTKLGPEVTTCDIPNVGEAKLKNLAEDGIVRIGAEVNPGDILVGKITPKSETQLTPEERLLRSLFGEKARDVKDTSKRMEYGKKGRVVRVQVFSRENGDKLESGSIKRIHIEVAQIRNVSVGDKLAGRHGNKGVIAKILPEEDMPYMADGTPVDVILTPLGVPSRMNLGQILELHLGLAAKTFNYQAVVPPFGGATSEEIKAELERAGYQRNGKMKLYDGLTGEAFKQDVAVGYMYVLKLDHMVEDKIHMRSIGPYSLITQQPLGGKAQGGGQRFGEMEVWAFLGYGVAYNLREMLTIKSDDITGRSKAFDSMVKGESISGLGTPASFNVLLNNLRGLALNVELIKKRSEQ